MSDLEIVIELPPDAAVAGAKKVTDEVDKTEAAGKRATAAYKALGDTFAKIAQQQMTEAAAATKKLGELAVSASKGIASVAEAIKREQDILKSIHGDMAAYQRDVQTLDALHKRGAISAKEHAAGISAARSNAGIKNPMDAVSLPSLPGGSGNDTMGKLGELAAYAGGATAALAIGKQVLDSWLAYDQAQTNAFNTLRKYVPAAEDVNEVLAQQADNARALNVSLGESVDAYSAVREATNNLYLSSYQQTKITRTLGEEMKLNNKPIGEASALMERLQADMELGTMSGGEFRSILKTMPDIIDLWADKMGKSSTELYEMAKAGKIGRAEMEKMFAGLEDGGAVHEKFAQRQKSVSDKFKEGGVDALIFGERVNQMTEVLARSNELDLEGAENLKAMAAAQGQLTPILDKRIEQMRSSIDEGERFYLGLKKQAEATYSMNVALSGQISLIKMLTGIVASAPAIAAGNRAKKLHDISGASQYDQAMRDRDDVMQAVADNLSPASVAQGIAALANINKALGNNETAVKKTGEAHHELGRRLGGIVDGIRGLGTAWDAATDSINEYIDAANKRWDVDSIFAAHANPSAPGFATHGIAKAASDIANDNHVTEAEKQSEAAQRLIDRSKELHGVFQNELIDDAHQFTDALVEAANGADVSFGSLFKNMVVGFEKAIAQAIELKLLTGSYTGAAGPDGAAIGGLFGALGFSTGGDATYSGGRLMRSFPGAAMGMDAMLTGAGPTDSKLVGIRMTPGETLHVRTARQNREAAQSSNVPMTVNNIIQQDHRALLPILGSPEGQREQMNFIRMNAGPIRAALGIR